MRERLEQALSELPLDKADITSIAQRLLGSNQLLRGNRLPPVDSAFFDFRGKIEAVADRFAPDGLTLKDYLRAAVKCPQLCYQSPATIESNIKSVVEHFGGDGLTLKDYLRAVLKQPSLFCQSPATIQSNIEAVVEHFGGDGLTLKDYLPAALKQPSLFCQSPATIQSNIEAVVEHFGGDGLTLKDYLRAVLKQPSLFCQSPATIQSNIEAVASHFRDDGLTLMDYLRAAVKQPQLFYQSPATIESNIDGLVEHFRAHGLMSKEYLRAAVKQPSLFCQSPATIIGHVNMVADLYRKALVRFRQDDGQPAQPLQPMFNFLLKNPQLLSLADENFMLREVTARVGSNIFSGKDLLRKPRHAVESDLAARLGHGDLRLPVPKEPDGDGNHDRHTRNLLLRSLIRANLVKGINERVTTKGSGMSANTERNTERLRYEVQTALGIDDRTLTNAYPSYGGFSYGSAPYSGAFLTESDQAANMDFYRNSEAARENGRVEWNDRRNAAIRAVHAQLDDVLIQALLLKSNGARDHRNSDYSQAVKELVDMVADAFSDIELNSAQVKRAVTAPAPSAAGAVGEDPPRRPDCRPGAPRPSNSGRFPAASFDATRPHAPTTPGQSSAQLAPIVRPARPRSIQHETPNAARHPFGCTIAARPPSLGGRRFAQPMPKASGQDRALRHRASSGSVPA